MSQLTPLIWSLRPGFYVIALWSVYLYLFLFAPFLDSYMKLDPIEHQEFTRALPHCADEQIHGNDAMQFMDK